MTRTVMMIFGSLYPKFDVDRVFVSRCNGETGLINIEIFDKMETKQLGLLCEYVN